MGEGEEEQSSCQYGGQYGGRRGIKCRNLGGWNPGRDARDFDATGCARHLKWKWKCVWLEPGRQFSLATFVVRWRCRQFNMQEHARIVIRKSS